MVFIYRGSLLAMMLGAIVLIALQYFVWRRVFSDTDTRAGVTFTQVVLYAVLARLWVFVVPGFRLAIEFERRMRDGSIVRELMYPASFIGVWLAKALGRSAAFLVTTLPLLIGSLFLVRPDLGIGSLVPAAISAVSGYLIAFALAGFVGLSALFLRRADGLNEMRDALNAVLGGSIIPLAFYPERLTDVIMVLPFAHIYYVPIGLFTGMTTVGWTDVVVGSAWAVGLLAALVVAAEAARPRLALDGG
ncbi:ABC-2 family transporter protein [Micromonospora sp. NPDC003197]